MATHKQSTGWYQPTHETQREFERKHKQFSDLSKKVGLLEAALSGQNQQTPIPPASPETFEVVSATGIIEINRLTKDPATRPPSDIALNDYIYYPWQYDPSHGYFGYYVYNVIEHYLQLDDPNIYFLEMIDLHKTVNDDDTESEHYPFHYGLDWNRIIVWEIYKGGLGVNYMGGSLPTMYAEWEDEPNRIIKTDMRFRWNVHKPIRKVYPKMMER